MNQMNGRISEKFGALYNKFFPRGVSYNDMPRMVVAYQVRSVLSNNKFDVMKCQIQLGVWKDTKK